MASSSSKKFILKSSDGKTFEIDEAAAAMSKTIQRFIDAGLPDNVIPLPKVTGSILAKVVEYCNKHANIDANESEPKLSVTQIDGKDPVAKHCQSLPKVATDEMEISLHKWDAEFVKVDRETLLDLTLASNYLVIKSLTMLTCNTVVDTLLINAEEEILEENE